MSHKGRDILAEDYFIFTRQHSVGVKMKVHMWAARRPQSFHRGKTAWLTSPLWNAVNPGCVSHVLHCRKTKRSTMFYYSESTWSHITAKIRSFNESDVDLIHRLRILVSHVTACCVGLLPPSSHRSSDLIYQKPLRGSGGFDFTCLTVTDAEKEDFSSPGSSSMLICVSWHFHPLL